MSLTSLLMLRPNDRYALADSKHARTAAGFGHGGHRGKYRV
ncbi:MAG TPA: hypothetical protein VG123_20465 [Streptosporangiaceae bacterium]|nr:hypothetical protein [Streptosporangiaceae bacterium]